MMDRMMLAKGGDYFIGAQMHNISESVTLHASEPLPECIYLSLRQKKSPYFVDAIQFSSAVLECYVFRGNADEGFILVEYKSRFLLF
jgi:hypothetical protein